MSKLLYVVLIAFLLGCSEETDPVQVSGFESLTQHWVRSYEEEDSETNALIFRPQDYKTFPPSRFRAQYIFEPDGSCQWYFLAPNDAHYFRQGEWLLDIQLGSGWHRLFIQEGDNWRLFSITELTPDLLRLEENTSAIR